MVEAMLCLNAGQIRRRLGTTGAMLSKRWIRYRGCHRLHYNGTSDVSTETRLRCRTVSSNAQCDNRNSPYDQFDYTSLAYELYPDYFEHRWIL